MASIIYQFTLRIEGITVGPGKVDRIVLKKDVPMDRSEQEVAEYRDVLANILTNHRSMTLSMDLIRRWHRALYHFTVTAGESWKEEDLMPNGSKSGADAIIQTS